MISPDVFQPKPNRYRVVVQKKGQRFPIVQEFPVREKQEAESYAERTGGFLVPPLEH